MGKRVAGNTPSLVLTPEDYRKIAQDHARLHELATDLEDTCCNLKNGLDCSGCGAARQASCRGRLPSFCFAILELSSRHFQCEELIMLSRPNVTEDSTYYRSHHSAHQNIIARLNRLANQSYAMGKSGQLAEAYRALHADFMRVLEEHDRTFDDPFIQSTLRTKSG